MNCTPTSCGNVTNITYPFWVDQQQPSHCGYPAFRLSCENQIPILKISSSDVYQIRGIFYENQSVLVANAEFDERPCPVRHWNLSFSLTPFSVSSVNREVVFLFDCSEPPQSSDYKVPCEDNGTNGTFAQFGNHLESSNKCQSAVMPVVDYSDTQNVSDYVRLLGNGFLVQWTAANCTECRDSKGQCGYSYANDNFMCICPDRAHWRFCAAEGDINSKYFDYWDWFMSFNLMCMFSLLA